jgi:parvulin-like peptidyl-prolyl isomerase
MTRYALALSSCLVVGLFACSSEEKVLSADSPLVQVGDTAIVVADLETFIASLPEHLHSIKTGSDAYREYLHNLLERELMRLEAEKRGLGDLSELKAVLDVETNKRLVQEVSLELVDRSLHVEDEELRQAYEEYDLGWQVWPAHILSKNEDDAWAVIDELRKGVPFSQVAKEHSRADDAIKGGNLGAYFGEGDVVPALREATFHLEEGQFSDPIRTVDGFEVVQVIKKGRKGFAQMRSGIAKQMIKRKWNERRDDVIDSLGALRNIRVERARVHAVLKGLFRRGLKGEEAEDTLISYDGGRILVGDAIRGIRDLKKGALPPDSVRVFQEINRWILPDSLMVLVAREQGRQERVDMAAWRQKRRVALIVNQLRVDQVAGKVKISDEEVEAYYQQHLDSYKKLPGPISMTEVLVETKEEAGNLLVRYRAGERLESLAVLYSLRSMMTLVGGHVFADSGRIEIESLYQSPYRTFFGDSNDKDVGVVQGPLEVQDRYSIFRLDKAIEKSAVSFKQVQRPIRVKLREQGEAQIFTVFLDSLRAAYADQVQWDEEMLALYASGH